MIVVKREGELEAQTWTFTYLGHEHSLTLTSWNRLSRPSTRRKFRADGEWLIGRLCRPDVPPDVLDEARRQFVETLKVEG